MGLSKTIWSNPTEFLISQGPENPVLFFAPAVLHATARRFIDGFPGMVTYAVKANPDPAVIENLAAAGVAGFDVASPAEMLLVRRLVPEAALHYNNPVRSRQEIATAVALGVQSYSVDSRSELEKLVALVPAEGTEIAVRFKLPVAGAAYDFGAKFGASADLAVELLRRVAEAGFVPALTFHPGTQCTDPAAWTAYLHAAADIARRAGVRLARLNVGGGFPSQRREGERVALDAIFALIGREARAAFGAEVPALVCEPGRGMVAEAFTLSTRVKAIRDDAHVFLNDGTYGNLVEMPMIGAVDRVQAVAPDGTPRKGAPVPRVVFGPTCDSVDRLPGELCLPADLAEEDHLLFAGMGAYTLATNTQFNGFGNVTLATVLALR